MRKTGYLICKVGEPHLVKCELTETSDSLNEKIKAIRRHACSKCGAKGSIAEVDYIGNTFKNEFIEPVIMSKEEALKELEMELESLRLTSIGEE